MLLLVIAPTSPPFYSLGSSSQLAALSRLLQSSHWYNHTCSIVILPMPPLPKDLDNLGRDLNKIIIVDNLSENFRKHSKNGIFIKSWFGEEDDTALYDLVSLLKRNCELCSDCLLTMRPSANLQKYCSAAFFPPPPLRVNAVHPLSHTSLKFFIVEIVVSHCPDVKLALE